MSFVYVFCFVYTDVPAQLRDAEEEPAAELQVLQERLAFLKNLYQNSLAAVDTATDRVLQNDAARDNRELQEQATEGEEEEDDDEDEEEDEDNEEVEGAVGGEDTQMAPLSVQDYLKNLYAMQNLVSDVFFIH